MVDDISYNFFHPKYYGIPNAEKCAKIVNASYYLEFESLYKVALITYAHDLRYLMKEDGEKELVEKYKDRPELGIKETTPEE
jgi:hypothetical protein